MHAILSHHTHILYINVHTTIMFSQTPGVNYFDGKLRLVFVGSVHLVRAHLNELCLSIEMIISNERKKKHIEKTLCER